ncbi:SIS domain-containing protein [Pseudorhodoferax sp. Leaf267]|uniref:SIS domain-containing protein n=1 Tax=Pseudorhodoferax sp. Leaf267 TaxID=1736316 RepID=UPI0006F34233|nr:SIS domain-containing protein [Pseudorhodoferax sp. Leaf267]KQP13231.1 iron dicitrate transport regulator FecR [Pseudorhodoferax sp. Leaf267]
MLEESRSAPACVARQLTQDTARYTALGQHLRSAPPDGGTLTVARGSSDHAASYLAYLLMARYGRLVTSLPMSLVTLYGAPLRHRHTLVVGISQSGRSPDLVEPFKAFRQGGGTTVALVNAADSPLAEAAEWALPLHAGPELSVAATKSFICALSAAARLAAHWHEDQNLLDTLHALPPVLEQAAALDWSAGIEALAGAERMMVIGRGTGLAVAQEAALKLKETCAIQAEVFSSAEVQHGPMALVDAGYPMLVFAPPGPAQAGLLELARQMRARGAQVLLAAPPDVAERQLTLATSGLHELDPITAIQSFYGLAEAVSRARGRNPDRPPHLRKVTSTL